ncbi:MAG TPA: metal-dependent transcriptional regulator [Candidatus Methylomirabilis sp.]|jgi:DtxR family Mn-dependent transcriptional regulator
MDRAGAAGGSGAATTSVENYLKAIYHQGQGGRGVIAARLAEALKVSPPAVTSAVRRLARKGYVTVDRNKVIGLTADGLEVARHLICRHRLVERLLMDVLGMEWYRVHQEAEKLEHAISPDVEARLMKVFGDRRVCPHGSSFIPEGVEARRRRGERLLADAPVDRPLQVAEVDDEDPAFLEYLDGLRIIPGVRLQVRERLYDGTLRLQVDGRTVHLGKDSAGRVWMRPLSGPRPRAASR